MSTKHKVLQWLGMGGLNKLLKFEDYDSIFGGHRNCIKLIGGSLQCIVVTCAYAHTNENLNWPFD